MMNNKTLKLISFLLPAAAFITVYFHNGWQWNLSFREQQQLFMYDWDYIFDLLFQKGGLSILASRFIVQFFWNPVVAVVISAILAGLTSLFCASFIHRVTGKDFLMLASIILPILLIPFLKNNYFHYEVLLACVFTAAVLNVRIKRKWLIVPIIALTYLAIWPFADKSFYREADKVDTVDRFYKYEILSENEDWESLEQASKKYLPAFFDANYYHLALARQGELSKTLFDHPQAGPHCLIFIPDSMSADYKIARILFSMGNYAGAQNVAFNYISAPYGYSPSMVKIIALIEQIRGCEGIAEKYLSLLEKSLRYRKWAKRTREEPAHGTLPEDESFVLFSSTMDDLFTILDTDPSNQIAKDYGMSYLLLSKDLNNCFKFIEKYYSETDLQKLPTAAQEALLFFSEYYANMDTEYLESQGLSPEFIQHCKSADIDWCRNHGVTQGAIDRFEAFKKADIKHDGKGLSGYYDTFWYYLLYKKI